MQFLCTQLQANESWLMERILSYAKKQGYAQYTSTLLEAWRVSVHGLIEAVVAGAAVYGNDLPEFWPEEKFEEDPVTQFGVEQARLHRQRGISLSMYLGLYKYYRYTFQDFVQSLDVPQEKKDWYHAFVERCFDRIEIAFCNQWSSLKESRAVEELQEANRAMTNEKNKYLTLFESLDLPALLLDENGVVENVNIAAAELVGKEMTPGEVYYSLQCSDEIRGKAVIEILPWLRREVDAFLTGGQRSQCHEVVEPKEFGGRVFQVQLSRMRDVSGKFKGGVCVLHDITEHRRMEQLKGDVERITKHDLKTPLSGMLTAIECLLGEENISEAQHNILMMAKSSGYTMLSMINRSLDLYKMETGTYVFEPKCVNLQLILERVVAHTETLAKSNGVNVVLDPAQDEGRKGEGSVSGPMLFAEDMLLYTALGNVLTNAIQASPPNGSVHVSIAIEDTCHITVTNPGGVPKQIKESFFEKYATWGKKNGSGLGTYSARLIVETMGGNIAMESDGVTTSVTISIPLAA